jgi:hypothetical protein
MPEEAGEWRVIHRSMWESLVRHTDRLDPHPRSYVTWWSALAGFGGSSFLGFVTEVCTGHNGYALVLLGVLAAVGGGGAYIIKNIEDRQALNETSHTQALKEEMEAAGKYMVDLEEIEKRQVTAPAPPPSQPEAVP